MADKVDHSHGDAGEKPPQDLNFQDGDFPDPEIFDWFWSEIPAAINNHADQLESKDAEWVEDIISGLISSSGNINVTYDDANDKLTIGTSALSEEQVEDAVASLITGGNGISVTYDDANDNLTIKVDDKWINESGDTMNGDLTMEGTIDLDTTNGRLVLPVGTDLFSTQ